MPGRRPQAPAAQSCVSCMEGGLHGQSGSPGSSQIACSPSEASEPGEERPLDTRGTAGVSGHRRRSHSRDKPASLVFVRVLLEGCSVHRGPDVMGHCPLVTAGGGASLLLQVAWPPSGCPFSLLLSPCLEGREENGLGPLLSARRGTARCRVVPAASHTHCGARALWDGVLPGAPLPLGLAVTSPWSPS